MRRAIPALLIAIVAAFAVAACGGSDDSSPPTKAEYKQEYQKLIKELSVVDIAVSDAVNGSAGKSNTQLEKTFGEAAKKVRGMAGKFDDTTPPADATIKSQQAKLVAGLNVFADDLDAISSAAGKKNLKAAGAAAAKLSRDDAATAQAKVALDQALGIQPSSERSTTTQK